MCFLLCYPQEKAREKAREKAQLAVRFFLRNFGKSIFQSKSSWAVNEERNICIFSALRCGCTKLEKLSSGADKQKLCFSYSIRKFVAGKQKLNFLKSSAVCMISLKSSANQNFQLHNSGGKKSWKEKGNVNWEGVWGWQVQCKVVVLLLAF